ncbi:MAG TPA: hypothetical protein PKW95_23505 [bacterium]|nr:hypothetical protein [bacterium]
MKKMFIPALGGVIGAIGGYLYFFYVGCTNGCPLKSNGPLMTVYGALLGAAALPTLVDIFKSLARSRRLRRQSTPGEESSS